MAFYKKPVHCPHPPVKIEEAQFVVKQEDRKPKFKKLESTDPPLDPPSCRSACVPEVRKMPQRQLDPNETDFYFLSDSPNTSLDTQASLDASPTHLSTEAAACVSAAAFSPRPTDTPSHAPSTTVCKHKARTCAAPPVATLISSPPTPASPRPPAPVSARAPTTVGVTAPAPTLAHAPAPALACASTASPVCMAARELNSQAGVHLAPPAVLAPALALVSAPDSNGDFARSTTPSHEHTNPARERTVPDSFAPVPRSTITMPQPMRRLAPITYATPARSICVRSSESPSHHNSKSLIPGPSMS
ncbi:hypothetical protein B0H14DRAFT_3531156 [Mycena olivaceomarginata]|nr:hypothetical protein B0H14DRAFT_3531156 [Mycena olivaceomarginata]